MAYTTTPATPNGNPGVKWASGLNVIAGLWLIISPWVLANRASATYWDDVIVGVVVAVLAFIRAAGWYSATWMSWLNVLLGLWLIVSPWVLRAQTSQAYWNEVIVGVIIAILGAWSAFSSSGAAAAPPTTTTTTRGEQTLNPRVR